MSKKSAVSASDDVEVLTSEQDAINKNADKRLTRLEAMMRRLVSAVEIHWGKDINLDGKIGLILVAVLLIPFMAFSEETLVDWASGQYSTAKAKITAADSASEAVFQVDAISNNNGKVTASNLTLKAGGTFTSSGTLNAAGTLQIGGVAVTATAAEINSSCDATIGETTRYIAGNSETVSYDATNGITKGVLDLQSECAAGSSQCTNGSTFDLRFRMNNKAGGTSTQVFNYAIHRVIVTDSTGGSEDATDNVIIPIAGTTTTVTTVSSTGLDVNGRVNSTGASTQSGAWTFNGPFYITSGTAFVNCASIVVTNLPTAPAGLAKGAWYIEAGGLNGTNVVCSAP